MSQISRISAGEYQIGNDHVPNAGPRHARNLRAPLWMDSQPLSWAHFEVFVAAGGFAQPKWWPALAQEGIAHDKPSRVDARVEELLQSTEQLSSILPADWIAQWGLPLTGVTWFEANAVCAFFQARLPFEAEWEASLQCKQTNAVGGPYPVSEFGCQFLMGAMQEWTVDAYFPKYFRHDQHSVGIPWSPDTSPQVTVRGSSSEDIFQDVSARQGKPITNSEWFRGFRRVWDALPDPQIVGTQSWRCD